MTQEAALAERMLWDAALAHLEQGILVADARAPDYPIVLASPSFTRITGYSTEEVLGKNCRFLQGAETSPSAAAELRSALEEGRATTVEILNYRKNGQPFWNEVSLAPLRDATGRITHVVGLQHDVTKRRELEEQVRASQRIEAVGRLAGGIAHDFNNLLSVVLGYVDLIEVRHHEVVAEELHEIRRAAERAAELTKKLLAFSRRQVFETRVLSLATVVRELEKMLTRVLPENVKLVVSPAPSLWPIEADSGQIEQALLELALNAGDAMPHGGTVRIGIENCELDAAFASLHPGSRPGPYVRLSVEDDGEGMTLEVKSRLFEPFFSTKGPGKGTGLGLPTVYGIVKQSGGAIYATSEPGKGARFDIYLPKAHGAEGSGPSPSPEPVLSPGVEKLLVVEDDPALRRLVTGLLRRAGHTVLEAASAEEALALAETPECEDVALLVTDVVLPGLSGDALARKLRERRPGLRILFVSGYANLRLTDEDLHSLEAGFLQKPFSGAALTSRVRRLLDAKVGP